MKYEISCFQDTVELQVEMLTEARRRLVSALNQKLTEHPELSDLEIKTRGGRGIAGAENDRRLYVWISCRYKGKKYAINLFHSEIDPDSGNCHCQIGKVMFTRDYVVNRRTPASPNEILKDEKGEFLTNEKVTTVHFNSYKWEKPLDYFTNKDTDRLANGKWVTVDDILKGDGPAEEIAEAFFRFIK